MHVIGDGAADGNETRARRHGKEPAARHDERKYVSEQYAGLAGQHATIGIEGDEAVEAAHLQQRAAGIQPDIAIAATIAVGEQRPLDRRQRGTAIAERQLRRRGRPIQPAPCGRRALTPIAVPGP